MWRTRPSGIWTPDCSTLVQQAATVAAAEGVTMTITSGWRSPEFRELSGPAADGGGLS